MSILILVFVKRAWTCDFLGDGADIIHISSPWTCVDEWRTVGPSTQTHPWRYWRWLERMEIPWQLCRSADRSAPCTESRWCLVWVPAIPPVWNQSVLTMWGPPLLYLHTSWQPTYTACWWISWTRWKMSVPCHPLSPTHRASQLGAWSFLCGVWSSPPPVWAVSLGVWQDCMLWNLFPKLWVWLGYLFSLLIWGVA